MRHAFVLAASLAATPAMACGPGTVVGAGDMRLAYRIEPAAAVGKMVAVEVTTCDGVTLEGLDARMPVHGHGLNYRPRVAAAGPGGYRVEGMLFHMPGPWQLVFDVRADGVAKRLTADMTIAR